jgi:hypothetical protein
MTDDIKAAYAIIDSMAGKCCWHTIFARLVDEGHADPREPLPLDLAEALDAACPNCGYDCDVMCPVEKRPT